MVNIGMTIANRDYLSWLSRLFLSTLSIYRVISLRQDPYSKLRLEIVLRYGTKYIFTDLKRLWYRCGKNYYYPKKQIFISCYVVGGVTDHQDSFVLTSAPLERITEEQTTVHCWKTMYNLLELYSTMPTTKTVQRHSLTPLTSSSMLDAGILLRAGDLRIPETEWLFQTIDVII